MNELAKKTMFLNPNINFISNSHIVEYDMRRAGFSLIQKYELLPKKEIERLRKIGDKETVFDKKYGKHQQDVEIGKMQRYDKDLSLKLKLAFELEREKFIEKNQLDESDIISIKKDAFFICTMKPIVGKIDDLIEFREKNIYSSYVYIKPLEIYYTRGKDLDIKGIGDDAYELHRDYMCKFLIKALSLSEEMEKSYLLKYMRNFIDKYKFLELESGYYRTFNASSKFEYLDGEISDIEYRDDVRELNIMPNLQFILKLLQYMIAIIK